MKVDAVTEGALVRMLRSVDGHFHKGDVARIVTTSCFHDGCVADVAGDYWGDFRGQGNTFVGKHEKQCIGRLGKHFELIVTPEDPEELLP